MGRGEDRVRCALFVGGAKKQRQGQNFKWRGIFDRASLFDRRVKKLAGW